MCKPVLMANLNSGKNYAVVLYNGPGEEWCKLSDKIMPMYLQFSVIPTW